MTAAFALSVSPAPLARDSSSKFCTFGHSLARAFLNNTDHAATVSGLLDADECRRQFTIEYSDLIVHQSQCLECEAGWPDMSNEVPQTHIEACSKGVALAIKFYTSNRHAIRSMHADRLPEAVDLFGESLVNFELYRAHFVGCEECHKRAGLARDLSVGKAPPRTVEHASGLRLIA